MRLAHRARQTVGVDLAVYLEALREQAGGHRVSMRAPDLARHFGVSERVIRATVSDLRARGFPIASGDEGYWYATCPAELEHTLATLRSRALEILRVRKGLRMAFVARQVELALWGES